MNQETKDKLKLIPRVKCFKCLRNKSYINPIDRCYECGNKFCFDHLYGGQVNEKMSKNEPARSICEDCKIKHNYQSL